MFQKFVSLCALASQVQAQSNQTSNHWAVLVAGSNTWSNYRHQADVCHAYQVLLKNGYLPEQIITMAYDDIANSPQNPFPGKIFNKPAKTNGVDVYEGCNIDYKGEKVTAANLYAVLQGDAKTAGGKVLKSDENSKIFLYYSDHGAPGFVGMPSGDYVYADKLQASFNYMSDNKMYKELTVYMESCESGSMFENILPADKNIYALSAAKPDELSWGTYCSPDDVVNGKAIGSCLGDLFSVNWMEDADKAQWSTETLQTQFETVQKLTDKSHVLQWGQVSIANELAAEFETAAAEEQPKLSKWEMIKEIGKKAIKQATGVDKLDKIRKNKFAVDSYDIKLHNLYSAVMRDPSKQNHEALMTELADRMLVDNIFNEVFPQHMESVKTGKYMMTKDFDCYRKYIQTFEEHCGKASDYALKYFKVFSNECSALSYYPEILKNNMNKLLTACQKQ